MIHSCFRKLLATLYFAEKANIHATAARSLLYQDGVSSFLVFIMRAVPGGGKLTQLITLAHTQPSPQAPADGEKREVQHAGGSSGCALCPEKQEAARMRDPEPL